MFILYLGPFLETIGYFFSDPLIIVVLLGSIVLGLVLGTIPGIGALLTLTLLIPLTFGMDPLMAFMIFIAAKGGTNFGGSISSILLNTPGTAANAATLIDGYPMARNGDATAAISASAFASAGGAIIGIIFLLLTIPLIRDFMLLFGPPEIFWLAVWGISMIVIVMRGGYLLGLLSALLGIAFGLHGVNSITGQVRWNYDTLYFYDGIGLIPLIVGMFAIAEMMNLLMKGERVAEGIDRDQLRGNPFQGWSHLVKHKWTFLRGSLIGTICGAIPGVGSLAATYIAYGFEAQKDPDKFGKGDIRGVIAPESSNDAKDASEILPTVGLGIPGSASMAIVLGAFIFHGMNPGPHFLNEHFDIVMMMIVTLFISNVLTSLIGITLINKLTLLTTVDTRVLAPIIFGVGFLGAFAVNQNIYDVYLTGLFGVMGLIMLRIDMSRIPMILAFILIPIIEVNYFRSLQISRGEHAIFFDSPITVLLAILTIFGLLYPLMKPYFSRISLARLY